MKKSILDAAREGVILFDGGIGTELQALGLPIGQAPEGWNLQHPDRVAQVHQAYVNAGAHVLTTNTFGGSPHKLTSAKIVEDAGLINRRAAEIARKCAGEKVWVAGSMGPSGAMLMMEEVSEEELFQGFLIQAENLVRGGADCIIIETMSDLQEALIALRAAKQVCGVPVIASLTFAAGQRGYRTMMGVDTTAAVPALSQAGADVLGCNCGTGAEDAIEIIKEMRKQTNLPLLAEPNAGLPQYVDGRTVYKESPEIMAGKIPALIAAGANFIGGCCGTTPAHIAAFQACL